MNINKKKLGVIGAIFYYISNIDIGVYIYTNRSI